ncbi:glutathione-dependent disulfide-bond oxidoreductase [Agaribacterium sp. ZY112]|uniref:glutathione-dependent disulfide-bond oxidoreductase n=1 Tax=Agaribacterium sp. ZY112 TaxID=3233574 RepID=UPI003524D8E9
MPDITETDMDAEQAYQPERIWTWKKANGGEFANINRPIAGPTHDQELPRGKHPFQLYSMATPNGVKVTIMFEELLALGMTEAEYDAWLIRITEGEQFSSGFVDMNPNSKIPALIDYSSDRPVRVFESGSILLYLADKFSAFIPETGSERAEVLNWLFWQMGSAPYLGGGFGHFYAYAPEKMEYPIERFTMEVKRQLDVLNRELEHKPYIAGDTYSIADIAIYAWYGSLILDNQYDAAEFLAVHEYKHVLRWAKQISLRPAVIRGRKVNRYWGEESEQVIERHSTHDID